MRIWPPIHPGKANPPPFLPSLPSFLPSPPLKKNDRRWFGLFNLVAAHTAHICVVFLCTRFRACTTASWKRRIVRQKCRRCVCLWGGGGRGKGTYNFRAGNKLGALADVRGRRSDTRSPHPPSGALEDRPAGGATTNTGSNTRPASSYIFFTSQGGL